MVLIPLGNLRPLSKHLSVATDGLKIKEANTSQSIMKTLRIFLMACKELWNFVVEVFVINNVLYFHCLLYVVLGDRGTVIKNRFGGL
jgi:hypothetical protein